MYTHEDSNLAVIKQAAVNDPRVTAIGAFLRRWTDELLKCLAFLLEK